jgi:hypothetical protein
MKARKTGVWGCPSSVIAYNAVKAFGCGVFTLECRRVLRMLVVEDVVTEHQNYLYQEAEAKAKAGSSKYASGL